MITTGEIWFDKPLRDWDGFGVTYVETAQTRDYRHDPQEYGGYSILSEEDREKAVNLVFGEDGLKPGLVKMFLDPFHQTRENRNGPGDKIDHSLYDHKTTTKWLRAFVKDGNNITKKRGRSLSILTSLYSPPGWITAQGFLRGRDLHPEMYHECAKYMASWAHFLRYDEELPLDYIALHNEGESLYRWPSDGSGPCWQTDRDYNMYWPPEQVVDFLSFMRDVLDKNGLEDVKLTPGETSTWTRFSDWGYAQAIADSEEALKNLGLITSHGFIRYVNSKWFGDHRSTGTDLLRSRRPDLHAWVTSAGWGNSDVFFIKDIRDSIYAAKVNGYLPWVIIKRPTLWKGGDPNSKTALSVGEDGALSVDKGYYYYKQICRAGQPGMKAVHTVSRDLEIEFAAFSGSTSKNGKLNPDSIVITNIGDEEKDVHIAVRGTAAGLFDGFVTSPVHSYDYAGRFKVMKNCPTGVRSNIRNDVLLVSVPAKSVVTLFAEQENR